MAKSHRLTTEQRENLVAYIDGELEQETMRDFANTLDDNPVASHEVDVLKKTWDLLDYLERPEASEKVIEQTLTSLEVVSSDKKFEIPAWWSQVRQGVVYVSAVAGILVALSLGYLTANRWIPSKADDIAGDLQLIEDYTELQEIGSLAFLELLQDNHLVDKLKTKSRESRKPNFPGRPPRNK